MSRIPSVIGPYQILAQLGEGGMGVVYRGRDTKLNRDVAIKVLPEAFALDADRLARFTREAQMLASLNHPNIATIHGFEADSPAEAGRHLIMEFVDGEDLSQRIRRGAIPLDEVLLIARQIAEALEAAHEQGIVHRDLKPANIKVRPDGAVKVLDFGLAKAIEPGAESRQPGADAANSPTITTPAMTLRGVILGTAAYMSPEQARGRPVDHRADIWAFGAVLFEMLTGRRAFDGEDISVTLANVIKEAPPWDALPVDLPSSLRRLLHRCLNKDPKKRLDSIRDARLELDDASTAEQTSAPTATVRTSRLAWAAAAIASATAVALLVPAVQHWREIPPVLTETRLEIASPVNLDATNPTNFALSPDGRHLIFVSAGDSGNRLWLRSLDSTTATPLGGTDRAGPPFWSPDSRSIGFFADGLLKRLDLGAGAPRTLGQAPNSRGGTWNADGTIIFAPTTTSPLFRVSASGGEAVAVTRLTGDQTGHRYPFFLPDGRHLLYFAPTRFELGTIYLGTLDSPETTALTDAASAGVYLPSREARGQGWLLWERGGALVAQQLDLERRALTGDIVIVADAVARTSAGFRSAVSVSVTGLIAYRAGGDVLRQMTWVDRAGVVRGTIGPPDENDLRDASLSPDGRRLAVSRRVQGNIDVWLLDGIRSTRLTFDPGPDMFPVWSPDGTRIAYRSARSGVENLYVKSVEGGQAETLLVESAENKVPLDWSADGRFLLFLSGGGSSDLWVRPMQGDATPWVVLKTPFNEAASRFSPDGRFVAFSSNESGRMEVYVRPFSGRGDALPGVTAQWQVSTAGGGCPAWRADGKELYFEGLDGRFMAAPVTVRGSRLDAGTPVALFANDRVRCEGLGRQYDVARDGRWLINAVAGAGASPIVILQNWRPSQP